MDELVVVDAAIRGIGGLITANDSLKLSANIPDCRPSKNLQYYSCILNSNCIVVKFSHEFIINVFALS